MLMSKAVEVVVVLCSTWDADPNAAEMLLVVVEVGSRVIGGG
jgi:hypothetical protein